MKKLGKRLNATKQTLQAYGCPCGCGCDCLQQCNDGYQTVITYNGLGFNRSTSNVGTTTA